MKTSDERPTPLWIQIALALAILVYSLYFSLYQLQRYRAFWIFVDTVDMEQSIWNTLHGQFLRYTVYPVSGRVVTDFSDRVTESQLGEHVQPIMLLLALPYALFPRTETLLLIPGVAVGLGAIPFYRIAKRRLNSARWGLLLALGYLLLPAVQTANSWDPHGVSFLPPLFLAALDAAQQRKAGWWWLWTLLAMSCREDIPFVAGWAMLFSVPKELRRQAIGMFVLGFTWSVVSFFVIIPHFAEGGTPYLAFFVSPDQTGSADGIFALFTNAAFWQEKIGTFLLYNLRLAAPLLCLYWLHWPSLLAMAPTLAINSLSRNSATTLPTYSHYSLPVIPWTLVGAVEGWLILTRALRRRRPTIAWQPLLGGGLLVTILASHLVEGYTPLSQSFLWPPLTGQEAHAAAMLAQIPKDAPVSLDMYLAGHDPRRPTVRLFPDLRDAEWVLLNVWHTASPYGIQPAAWQALFTDPAWETVQAHHGLILLRKGQGPPQDIARAFAAPADAPGQPLSVQFGETAQGITLRAVKVNPLPGGNFYLCTDWQVATGGEFAFYAATTPPPTPLNFGQLYPALAAQPGEFRDCTRLTTIPRGKTVAVQLYVTDKTGKQLPITVVEAGQWGDALRPGADALQITLPAWW